MTSWGGAIPPFLLKEEKDMNYIIFDLEWNQPPEEAAAVQSPVHLTGEIVEIGAVKLDEHFSLIDELRLYITPKYYTKMHRKVASLTGIRDQDLKDRGKPFPDAYREFAAAHTGRILTRLLKAQDLEGIKALLALDLMTPEAFAEGAALAAKADNAAAAALLADAAYRKRTATPQKKRYDFDF